VKAVVFKDIDDLDVIIMQHNQIQCIFGCLPNLVRADGTLFQGETSTILFNDREAGVNVQGNPIWVLSKLVENAKLEASQNIE